MQPANIERYEPFLIEITENDQPFQDGLITRVAEQDDGWLVTVDGWTCLLPNLPIDSWGMAKDGREPIVPELGDRLRLYGSFGRPIEGMQVNGDVVFYRDTAMRAAKRRRDLEDYEAKKLRRFSIDKHKLDAEYDALPEFFKARIDRFRAEKADFRVESEAYELFCCTEAVQIANHLEALALGGEVSEGRTRADIITDVVRNFHDQSWGDGIDAGVVSDAHSNNTFGGACSLAAAYLRHKAGAEVSV